jgi:hypothetical protein
MDLLESFNREKDIFCWENFVGIPRGLFVFTGGLTEALAMFRFRSLHLHTVYY